MKPSLLSSAIVGLLLAAALPMPAQFRSGSDGSYGPLNVTSNTVLDMPPDGIFHCTTIGIGSTKTLKFRPNALNTPVYLLATGDVYIAGTIDVSGGHPPGVGLPGEGGPGGFDGGAAPNGPGAQGGDGLGPGGGRFPAGRAAFSARPPGPGPSDGMTYGNSLLMPLIGGSGGAGGRHSDFTGSFDYGGGGGGGAIMVASDTRIDFGHWLGRIIADGGTAAHQGNGSGGSIRVVAPVVAGTGHPNRRTFQTFGGNSGLAAGNGWMRVDTTNRFNYDLNSQGGTFTLGKFMQVFPTNTSRLDIIEAAGTEIPEGAPAGVRVTLPEGSPTNQLVRVQARDFSGIVSITVTVTPDAAPSVRYDADINMAIGNPAATNVSVVLPAGTSCRIHAWTR